MGEAWVSGWCWDTASDRFFRGAIGFSSGTITAVARRPARRPVAQGIIVPALVDAHTHVADTHLRDRIHRKPHSLEELVAPPGGLKHRFLRTAGTARVRRSIEAGLLEMLRYGTGRFYDFREGGRGGARLLRKSLLRTRIEGVILGRPSRDASVGDLLRVADGIGASGSADLPSHDLRSWANECHERGMPFAIHASEIRREDIDRILDLRPDLLVHLSAASPGDLHRVADAGIPVAICPRSNAYFGISTPVRRMVESGLDLALGTDNGMLASFSLWDELSFTFRLARLQGLRGPSATRRLFGILARGWKGLKPSPPMQLHPGAPSRFLVIGTRTEHPEARIVAGVAPDEIVFRGPALRPRREAAR